ncbi:MAG: hypothetical protein AB8G11_17420 [Saprospiraceae bacterium]
MNYLITIREFDHTTDAYHYKSILRENDIESYVEMLDFDEVSTLDAAELGKAKLSVLQGDIDDAKSILKEIDLEYYGEFRQNLDKFNENGLVIVKKMSYQEEAYLYKARLIDEGLTCFLVDKHATNPLPLVGITASTIELYVPKSELLTAEKIILEMDEKSIGKPNLESDNKPLLIGIVIVLIALFLLVQQYFSMY